ncbi:MAG TPA: DUF1559 domain-containing protein, partial [Thermoguttaceae bacterium]|nr:DUF1559 domain-containing protein [Thermoguttaceae bacterium]
MTFPTVQFRLRSLLLFALVVASAMAAGGLPSVLLVLYFLATCRFFPPRTLADLCLWFAVIGMIMALFLPSPDTSNWPERTERCATNLEAIASALDAYHEDHGHYPPASINDADGKPEHSWRVLILPYLGHKDLYDQYDFSKPWNAPANGKLASQIPEEYICPEFPDLETVASTTYTAVIGSGAAWSSVRTTTREDLRDGDADTILIVEAALNAAVPWMEPEDLAFDDVWHAAGSTSPRWSANPHVHRHRGAQGRGWHALMADGTVRFVPKTLPRETLESLLTINGGEEIDVNE